MVRETVPVTGNYLLGLLVEQKLWKSGCLVGMAWHGIGMASLYTEGIQLTAANFGGRCSDLTQEEVKLLWRYNMEGLLVPMAFVPSIALFK